MICIQHEKKSQGLLYTGQKFLYINKAPHPKVMYEATDHTTIIRE